MSSAQFTAKGDRDEDESKANSLKDTLGRGKGVVRYAEDAGARPTNLEGDGIDGRRRVVGGEVLEDGTEMLLAVILPRTDSEEPVEEKGKRW